MTDEYDLIRDYRAVADQFAEADVPGAANAINALCDEVERLRASIAALDRDLTAEQAMRAGTAVERIDPRMYAEPGERYMTPAERDADD